MIDLENRSHSPEKNLSVIATTASSVTLKWKLGGNDSNNILSLSVWYRPRFRVLSPPTLEWDQNASTYVARKSYAIYDNGFVERAHYTILDKPKSDYMVVAITNLKFSGIEYEFELQRVHRRDQRGRNNPKFTRITVRTQPIVPKNPPKLGAGCFYVYDEGPTNRTVKIYWQRGQGEYEVRILEDSPSSPSHMEKGPLDSGWMWSIINMKRHYFIFRSLSGAGASKTSSILNIPAQDDVLRVPLNITYSKGKDDSYILTWRRPENVSVTNYTIFWVDTLDKKAALRVLDFVYLPFSQNSFEVKANTYVGLGLSINTETSSSGLQIVKPS